MHDPTEIAPLALALAIILVASKIGGHVAAKLGQVAVLGELVAGVALGNVPATAWIRDAPFVDVLAQVGALVLLFDVGLDLTVREVLGASGSASLVAALGTIASLACGFAAASLALPDSSTLARVFLAAALTATSVGISARVLKDLRRTRCPEARVILGAAVIDDVIGLVILTVVSGSVSAAGGAARGHLSLGAIASIVGRAAGFFVVAFVAGVPFARRWFAAAAKVRTAGAQLAAGLAFCFFVAWAANAIGLAPIVGAFTAGLILEDAHSARFVARGERSLAELVEPVSSFLVPVFFVVMGARVDLRAFASPGALVLAGALSIAAVVGKLACGLGVRGDARRGAVAVAMIPRGEVTLIYASLGASLRVAGAPLLSPAHYSALVLVVVVTTLLTPAALKAALKGRALDEGPPATPALEPPQ